MIRSAVAAAAAAAVALLSVGERTARAEEISPGRAGDGGPCAGAPPEGEPVCFDGYVDEFNAGPNSTPASFSPIELGNTVCGTSGNFLGPGGIASRDTDFYRLVLSRPKVVTWTAAMEGGFAHAITTIDLSVPGGRVVGDFLVSGAGEPLTVSNLLPVGEWALFVSTAGFSGVPCGTEYLAAISGNGIVFDPPLEFALPGGAPSVHAMADLDGGGTIDVAVAIPNSNPTIPGVVRVFLNNGNSPGGTWLGLALQSAPVPVGRDPRGIAIGDLDGDGARDLVVANSGDGSVSIHFNNDDGSGTFSAGPVIGGFDVPCAVAVAALGEEPGLDIAVVERGSDDVVILEDGVPIATLPIVAAPVAIDPVDIDNDRDVDLVVSGLADAVSIIVNEPRGAFSVQAEIPVGAEPVDLATPDLNGDGFPEIVTADSGDSTLTVLVNLGTADGSGSGPVFAEPITMAAGESPIAVDSADLDGDGDPDLAVLAREGSDGDRPRRVLAFETLPGPVISLPVTFVVAADPVFIAAADLGGDALADLVTVNDEGVPNFGSVAVLLNEAPPCLADFTDDGDVDFEDLLHLIAAWGECQAPCPFDVDGDGTVDRADLDVLLLTWGDCPGGS